MRPCEIQSFPSLAESTNRDQLVRTIKESCLDRMIFFRKRSFRNTICEFLEHDHHERNHQGLENRLIDSSCYITAFGSIVSAAFCNQAHCGLADPTLIVKLIAPRQSCDVTVLVHRLIWNETQPFPKRRTNIRIRPLI